MSPWGQRGASAAGAQNVNAQEPRQPGSGLALIFGGVALVTAAICALLLLMQRSEQRKLIASVQGRDEQIGKLESARTEAQALVQEYAARETQAQRELASVQQATEGRAAEWARARAELEQGLEDLKKELEASKGREQQVANRADASLERSEVPALPPRAPNGPWIDDKTDFKASPEAKVYRPVRGFVDAELARAVQAAMLSRQVPMQTSGFEAYLDARAVVRTLQVTPREVYAVAIVVQLVMPLVELNLGSVAWTPVVVEFDEIVGSDPSTIETLFHDRVRQLAERVIDRARKGGPPGELASQLLPQPGATTPSGGGTTPPAQPSPAGGGRAPKPGGP